jgi:mono/diheme cytochrome c family protein
MKPFIRTFLVLIGLLVAGGVVFFGAGFYNVAANTPHWKLTFVILKAAKERSISVHSSDLVIPPLQGQTLLNKGFPHFHEMCRLCHGGPGYSRDEFAEGLYPNPPNLTSEGIQELDNAELYWVVKNGLKMTGMPAFGATHNEEALQAIIAFVRSLPNLTAEEYGAMVNSPPTHGEEEEHPHSGLREEHHHPDHE